MKNNTQDKSQLRLLGEYLPCSGKLLHAAIQKQKVLAEGAKNKRIGEIMLEEKMVSEKDLKKALHRQRAERLGLCPVFTFLNKTELAAIANYFNEISFGGNEQFIVEGETDLNLYILVHGYLEVFTHDDNNTEVHIAFVNPVSPIGEMGYFQGGVRTASVRAVSPSDLLIACYDNLSHYFDCAPHVADAFMDMVAQRQQEINQIVQKAGTEA